MKLNQHKECALATGIMGQCLGKEGPNVQQSFCFRFQFRYRFHVFSRVLVFKFTFVFRFVFAVAVPARLCVRICCVHMIQFTKLCKLY